VTAVERVAFGDAGQDGAVFGSRRFGNYRPHDRLGKFGPNQCG
jgi:hypothetical protein